MKKYQLKLLRELRKLELLRELRKLGRYLLTVDALHKRKGEYGYCQEQWRHPCGTPACAGGHYEHKYGRHPGSGPLGILDKIPSPKAMRSEYVLAWGAIFGTQGCNNARTGKQAGKYILRMADALSTEWRGVRK